MCSHLDKEEIVYDSVTLHMHISVNLTRICERSILNTA